MEASLPTSLKVLLWVVSTVYYMMLSYVGTDLSMPCHLSHHTAKCCIQIRSGPLRVLYEMKKMSPQKSFFLKQLEKRRALSDAAGE